MDFLLQFNSIANSLCALLNVEFIEGNHFSRTFIGQRFRWVLHLHNSGEYSTRDAELLKIAFLTKHLSEIKHFNESMFMSFRRGLSKCMKADDYYGIRMEIYTAASLVRKQIPFEKSESPDFLLRGTLQGISIECGSAHFSTPNGNTLRKLIGKVRNKGLMPYAQSSAALFLDATNLAFSDMGAKESASSEAFKASLRQELDHAKFGSVVSFVYNFDESVQSIEYNYIRVDSAAIASALKNFLDLHFPFGRLTRTTFLIPNQG